MFGFVEMFTFCWVGLPGGMLRGFNRLLLGKNRGEGGFLFWFDFNRGMLVVFKF